MLLHVLLPSPLGHHYYEAAQVAAFAVYVLLLLGQGYRRGYPQRAWLPLVAAATLGLVLGCQLVFLPLGQWLGWLRGDAATVQALAGGQRSVIGGAWGSFVAALALGRVLGFRVRAVLDAFAAPLCWALAVQSVGCVLAGCCWGEATASGWGMACGPGSAAYNTQVALGQLPAGTAHTPALVPTQLLHLLLCAGAGLVLHLQRHRAWPAGSRYLLGMGLLCLGRFIVEFWRDPAGEPLLAAPIVLGGVALAGMQWLMLAETLVLLGGWAWLRRRTGQAPAPTPVPAPHLATTVLMALGLLLATTRLAPATLSLAEVAALQLLLLLVLLAEGRTWLVTLGRGVPGLAGLPLALLLGGALLLATAQAPAPKRTPPPPGQGKSLTFSVGSLSSQYDERFVGSCNSGANTYAHRNRAGGAEVAYQWKPDSVRQAFSTVGGGVWVGNEQTEWRESVSTYYAPSPLPPTQNYGLFDVHAYVAGSRPSRSGRLDLAYRLGMHIGALSRNESTNTSTIDRAGTTNVLPELMLAIGKRQTVFGQVDMGYGAENALGSYTTRLALGSGLGKRYGSTVLLGYAASQHYPDNSMAFVSANLQAPAGSAFRGLSMEPYLATNFDRHNAFSLKLHYRLGLK